MRKLFVLCLAWILVSCNKEEPPKREFGDNPLKIITDSSEMIVSIEARPWNTGIGGRYMQFAIYANQNMPIEDAYFHFSLKFSFRPKRDTIVLFIPYTLNKWVKSSTIAPAPANGTISEVVLIKYENVGKRKVTYKPL